MKTTINIDLVEMISSDKQKAVVKYGANSDLCNSYNDNAYFNTGMDDVLRNVAILISDEKCIELKKFETTLDEYTIYKKTEEMLLKSLSENKEARELFEDFDDKSTELREEMEREYFVQGFLAGYKLLRSAIDLV
jgi:hypothetical protein